MMQKIQKYAYIIALLTSFLIFALFVLIRVRFGLPETYAFTLAIGICFLLSAAFAFIFPQSLWYFGLLISSSFWLFLIFVFISYLIDGIYEWHPAVESVIISGVACAGAMLGKRISKQIRSNATM
jgi:hypothetical protein